MAARALLGPDAGAQGEGCPPDLDLACWRLLSRYAARSTRRCAHAAGWTTRISSSRPSVFSK